MIPPVRSFRRPGRLVPAAAQGLRARCVRLRGGGFMPWHSTRDREELLLALRGLLHVEIRRSRILRRILRAGQCLFLPPRTEHRVVNRATTGAVYLYVTSAAAP